MASQCTVGVTDPQALCYAMQKLRGRRSDTLTEAQANKLVASRRGDCLIALPGLRAKEILDRQLALRQITAADAERMACERMHALLLAALPDLLPNDFESLADRLPSARELELMAAAIVSMTVGQGQFGYTPLVDVFPNGVKAHMLQWIIRYFAVLRTYQDDLEPAWPGGVAREDAYPKLLSWQLGGGYMPPRHTLLSKEWGSCSNWCYRHPEATPIMEGPSFSYEAIAEAGKTVVQVADIDAIFATATEQTPPPPSSSSSAGPAPVPRQYGSALSSTPIITNPPACVLQQWFSESSAKCWYGGRFVCDRSSIDGRSIDRFLARRPLYLVVQLSVMERLLRSQFVDRTPH